MSPSRVIAIDVIITYKMSWISSLSDVVDREEEGGTMGGLMDSSVDTYIWGWGGRGGLVYYLDGDTCGWWWWRDGLVDGPTTNACGGGGGGGSMDDIASDAVE